MNWRADQRRNRPGRPASLTLCPVVAIGPALTWPAFWDIVQLRLRDRGYRRSSLVVVRQVLRGLAKASGVLPANVTRNHLDLHFRRLTARRCSASWLAMNISILRTVFDRIHGLSLLEGRLGPKRADRLPRIISREDIDSLLKEAHDFREALLLGLLADGGVKIGEACTLTWADVLPDFGEIRVAGSGSTLARTIPTPVALVALIQEGKRRFIDGAHLFPGRRPGTPLSPRMAERIVRRCARRAGLPRHVTSMVLRHTYAVQALEAGLNIRELQTRLGHAGVKTTMLYQRCLRPEQTVSPLDAMNANPTTPYGTTPAPPTTHPRPASGNHKPAQPRLARWLRNRLGLSSG